MVVPTMLGRDSSSVAHAKMCHSNTIPPTSAPFRSKFREPAVGKQLRAHNVRRVVGAKEESRAGHFVHGAETLQRDGIPEALPHLAYGVRGQAHLVEERRFDGSGTERIHPNSARRKLRGKGPAERAYRRLRRRVHGRPGESLSAY